MDSFGMGLFGGGGGGASGAGFEGWYRSLPTITRYVTLCTFLMSIFISFEILPLSLIYLDWQQIYKHLQIWRIFTNIFFIGRFSFSWILHMYMWTQISGDLENNPVFVHSSKGSYLFFIVFQVLTLSTLSLILFWPTGLFLLSDPLLFSVLYYWSRRESYTPVSMSFFIIQGYQLPFFLFFLHLLMGRDLWGDVLGIASGHLYYFLKEILPAQGGPDLLGRTPSIFDTFVDKITSPSQQTRRRFAQQSQSPSSGGGGGGSDGGGGTAEGSSSTFGNAYNRNQSTDNTSTRAFTGRGYRLGGD